MSSIDWQTTLGYAEDSAISTRKAILLYYFDLDCIGCQQMDTVTYSSNEVISFMKENLISLRIDINKKETYEKYNTIWTPAFILLDFHGHEIQQTIGYLEPEKFIALMHLGIAKVHFSIGEFDAANVHLNKLVSQYPESSAIPEAIFFRGVNLYKQKNDPGQLKTAYETLLSDYPGNSWTKRAAPYRLI